MRQSLALAATLLCLALPTTGLSADKYAKSNSVHDRRILAACPSQPEIYEGILPKVDWKGFAERDLAILELSDSFTHLVIIDNSTVQQITVSPKDAKWLRRSSDCKADDKYVLIGKDGGVKRRWDGPLHVDDLFETIDAMPMRQFEMRTKGVN